MAAAKIKKKSPTGVRSSAMPKQGAIPCLILIGIILIIVAFFFFAGFHAGG